MKKFAQMGVTSLVINSIESKLHAWKNDKKQIWGDRDAIWLWQKIWRWKENIVEQDLEHNPKS